jgi:glutathione S-transferase
MNAKPQPALLPADPQARARVEEAERWGNETLQMFARRIVFAAALQDPAGFSRSAGEGRMGHLLYRAYWARRVIAPWIGRLVFATSPAHDQELLAELPPLLDQIDRWMEDGTLGADDLNVADFMIAPSLALILYRPDVKPIFEGRPALQLVDRLLPEPKRAVSQL